MKNPLYKRIPRELKQNFAKYVGMMLILICTICVGSSFQVTMNGATKYLEDIKMDNLQEDGLIETVDLLSEESIKYIQDQGLKIYGNFYAAENEFADSTKVLIFDERSDINIPVVFEGKLPSGESEIAIDHVFANNRGFKIGDNITLLGNVYAITGTVSLPDYTSLFMNNTDLMMNTKHFCVSVVSHKAFEEIDSKHITYRYSFRFEDRELKESRKLEIVEDIQKKVAMSGNRVLSILTSSQNQSISFLEMDMGTDGPFMTVFVYILVALIAFIFAILTSNTIEKESIIIGTLRASGYTKGEIIRHYLWPTIIIAVVGSAVGNALGYTVMIQPFLRMYYTSYSIGPISIEFAPATFVVTTVIPVVLMIGINYFMLAKKLSLTPLKFLRRELKTGKQKRALKLPDWSFLNRFRLRVIIQNKGSYIMLFIGVFLASFLLMFGIGLKPLMDHYTDSIDESLPYNYQYLLKAPVSAEGGEKVFMYELDAWFDLGGKDIGVSCYGIDEDSTFFKDAYVENGVSVSSALSKKLGLKEGDTLKLTDKNTDKEYEFSIVKVYPYNASLAMFISRSEAAKRFDLPEGIFNSLLSEKKLDIDESMVIKRISREDMLGAASQMMDSFSTVIQLVNIFSVAVYIIMIYILTRVVIEKNSLSISYMKVFGYNKKEIRKLYLTSTSIVVALSLFICLPIEVLMFKLVLIFLSSMIEGYISFYLPFRVYIAIIAIGLTSYALINAINIKNINKIPMTDALKNRE